MKSELIRHIKVVEDNGNIIEVKLWQVNPSPDKTHGYKYSFVYVAKVKRKARETTDIMETRRKCTRIKA